MKKLVACLAILVLITGCQSTKPRISIQGTKIIVIEPPKALFNCPQAGPVPNWQTLTNKQVVAYIDKLHKNAKVCKINMQQIEKFVAEAKKNAQS